MKVIGLIGNMSYESIASYYQLINQIIKKKLGRLHATKRVMVSVDFAEIEALQHQVNGQKPWKFYLLQLSRLKQHVLIFF